MIYLKTQKTPVVASKGILIQNAALVPEKSSDLIDSLYSGLLFWAPLSENKGTAETGQVFSLGGSLLYQEHYGLPCVNGDFVSGLFCSDTDFPFDREPCTMSVWVCKADDFDSTLWNSLLCYGNQNEEYRNRCITSSANDNFLGAGGYGEAMIGTTPLPDRQWIHCIATFVPDGTGMLVSLYLNGKLDSSGRMENLSTEGGVVRLMPRGVYLAGARIYNRVLSEDEIQRLSKEYVPEYYSNIVEGVFEEIQSVVSENKSKSYTIETSVVGNFSSGSGSGFASLVLASNGIIYGVPAYGSRSLKFNPTGATFSLIEAMGSGTNDQYHKKAILAMDMKIYTIPYRSKTILQFDPYEESSEEFISLGSNPLFYDATLAQNGKIYCLPGPYSSENSITELDLNGVRTEKFGEAISGDITILAPNGKIYLFGESIFELDTENKTITKIVDSSEIPMTSPIFTRGQVAANGKLYCFRHSGSDFTSKLCELDPETKQFSQYDCSEYGDLLLAPNGKLYFFYNKDVKEVDPDTKGISTIATLPDEVGSVSKAIVYSDGNIYGLASDPTTAGSYYIFKVVFTGDLTVFTSKICESPYLNS